MKDTSSESNHDSSVETRRLFVKRVGALAAAGLAGPLAGCAGGSSPNVPNIIKSTSLRKGAVTSSTPVQHIVVACQENHSFDHYFGFAPFVGSYGVPAGYYQPSKLAKHFTPQYPYHFTSTTSGDPGHDWTSTHGEWDNGKMDGFYATDGSVALGYYNGNDLPYYYSLFNNATLCVNYFCSVLGPTFPNRLYLLSGTSGGNTSNSITQGSLTYPCILDLLDQAGVTFKCYNLGEVCCSSGNNAFVFFQKYQNDPRVISFTTNDYLNDLKNGTLPQVSFIMSADPNAEHPPYDITVGMNYQKQFITALQQSTYWSSSAYFLTWDEGGGFFDHVKPPAFDAYGAGIRVPMFVVSPFAKTAHLEPTQYEHSSVLKFIEYVFALPTLASVNHQFDTSTPSTNNAAATGSSGPPAPPRDGLSSIGNMRECFTGV